MAQTVAWGTGQGIDGREAARQAVHEAIEALAGLRPSAAIVLAAQEYPVAEVFAGLSALPGSLPVWGMSTSRPFTMRGEQARSVVVAILSGSDWRIHPVWQPQFGRDSAAAGRGLAKALAEGDPHWNGLLLTMDGIQGEASQALPALTGLDLPVAGGLAAGEVQQGKTYQFHTNQWSRGALSALALGGRLRLSTALAQGWKDTGVHFTVTKARDLWVQELDHLPAAEAYARIFGAPARQWAFPPLNQFVRNYPLGMEANPGRPERIIRSPLQVEVDGSFRMNAGVGEGTVAHLMVGDIEACLENTRTALHQARVGLDKARPVLAMVFVDLAWQNLLETRKGQLCALLRDELGDIPLVGAYTLGQITRPSQADLVRFYNQALLVAMIGDA